MSRLKDKLFDLKKNNKKAFSVFIVSGYPDYEITLDIMNICADNGVDFIELGMPFSDPSADGPIIKDAGTIALNNGAKIKKTINLIKDFRKNNKTTPIVWMGYFNSIYNYGIQNFLHDVNDASIDGILTVDLPFEEQYRIDAVKNYDIDVINMITPTTTLDRTKAILKTASGFIYFVSIAGITGTKDATEQKIKDKVQQIKSLTETPVVVGFGIKNAQKAAQINTFADGAIVGSALVKIITENLDNKQKMYSEVKSFISTFK